MVPELILVFDTWTVLIVVVIALVLFGGSRIAGVGKGAGRAIREFKEETKGLNEADKKDEAPADQKADSAESEAKSE